MYQVNTSHSDVASPTGLDLQEAWSRKGVEWMEDDTEVKFRMKKSYQYRPDLSSGSLSDLVTLPNVPMFVSLQLTPPFRSISSVAGDVR